MLLKVAKDLSEGTIKRVHKLRLIPCFKDGKTLQIDLYLLNDYNQNPKKECVCHENVQNNSQTDMEMTITKYHQNPLKEELQGERTRSTR